MRKKLKEDKELSQFQTLNTTTIDTIIAFAGIIPEECDLNQGSLDNMDAVKQFFHGISKEKIQALDSSLMVLEKKQARADQWDTIGDFF